MNANKIIHEALGLCWHNTATKPEGYTHAHKCDDCDTIFLSGEEKSRKRPDYTSPVAYCELFGWLKTEGRMLTLGSWWFNRTGENFDSFMKLSTGDQTALIAEAIFDGVLK